jgi:hypothetical protein
VDAVKHSVPMFNRIQSRSTVHRGRAIVRGPSPTATISNFAFPLQCKSTSRAGAKWSVYAPILERRKTCHNDVLEVAETLLRLSTREDSQDDADNPPVVSFTPSKISGHPFCVSCLFAY